MTLDKHHTFLGIGKHLVNSSRYSRGVSIIDSLEVAGFKFFTLKRIVKSLVALTFRKSTHRTL